MCIFVYAKRERNRTLRMAFFVLKKPGGVLRRYTTRPSLRKEVTPLQPNSCKYTSFLFTLLQTTLYYLKLLTI